MAQLTGACGACTTELKIAVQLFRLGLQNLVMGQISPESVYTSFGPLPQTWAGDLDSDLLLQDFVADRHTLKGQ